MLVIRLNLNKTTNFNGFFVRKKIVYYEILYLLKVIKIQITFIIEKETKIMN